MPSSAWSSDVCSSDRSEEHTSELQSQSNLVCRIIRSEEHTSELSHSQISYAVFCLKKKKRLASTSRAQWMLMSVFKKFEFIIDTTKHNDLPIHGQDCK